MGSAARWMWPQNARLGSGLIPLWSPAVASWTFHMDPSIIHHWATMAIEMEVISATTTTCFKHDLVAKLMVYCVFSLGCSLKIVDRNSWTSWPQQLPFTSQQAARYQRRMKPLLKQMDNILYEAGIVLYANCSELGKVTLTAYSSPWHRACRLLPPVTFPEVERLFYIYAILLVVTKNVFAG